SRIPRRKGRKKNNVKKPRTWTWALLQTAIAIDFFYLASRLRRWIDGALLFLLWVVASGSANYIADRRSDRYFDSQEGRAELKRRSEALADEAVGDRTSHNPDKKS